MARWCLQARADGGIIVAITPADKTHVPDNFLTALRDLRDRMDRLERLAAVPSESGQLTVSQGVGIGFGMLNMGSAGAVTIDTAEISITSSYIAVDTEAEAATDDLETIYGGHDGDILIIKAYDSARSVVLIDNTGNLRLQGNQTLDHEDDRSVLQYDGVTEVWVEISRANNS